MSARVLLISFNRYRDPYPVFPLGTAYLADSLVSAGHAVMPVDLNVDGPEWIDAARCFAPQLIGISIRNVDEVNIDGGETLLGGLRELVSLCRGLSGAKIVIGGPAVSLFPAEILRLSGADMAVRGEGETAIRLLADAAAEGRELAAPWLLKPGVRREPVSAPPGFAPVSDAAFRRRLAPFYLAHSGMMNLQTQRGCPLKCSYCTYPSIEGAHVRRREMADVMAELRLMKEAGARYFFIVDGVLNNARSHVVEFCEALIREKLDLSWCCFLRPSKIDAELARLMARAGLAHAEMGSDSLAGEMLASYGKHFDFEEIRESSLNLLAAGVKICHFTIFGGPGETRESVRETFRLSREIPGAIFLASMGVRIYPGTPLFARLSAADPTLTGRSLLQPVFHVEPPFSAQSLTELVRELARGRSEWIVPPQPPEIEADILKMRRKGVLGPLWDYMEVMQRFSATRVDRARLESSRA